VRIEGMGALDRVERRFGIEELRLVQLAELDEPRRARARLGRAQRDRRARSALARSACGGAARRARRPAHDGREAIGARDVACSRWATGVLRISAFALQAGGREQRLDGTRSGARVDHALERCEQRRGAALACERGDSLVERRRVGRRIHAAADHSRAAAGFDSSRCSTCASSSAISACSATGRRDRESGAPGAARAAPSPGVCVRARRVRPVRRVGGLGRAARAAIASLLVIAVTRAPSGAATSGSFTSSAKSPPPHRKSVRILIDRKRPGLTAIAARAIGDSSSVSVT